MKRLVVLLALVSPSAHAQASTDEQVRSAYATCAAHRTRPPGMNPKYVIPPGATIKSWEPGWEHCSTTQDKFEAIEAKARAAAEEKAKARGQLPIKK